MTSRKTHLRSHLMLGASLAAMVLGIGAARAESTSPFGRGASNTAVLAAQAGAAQAQRGASASAASQRALAAFSQAATIRRNVDAAQVAARAAAAAARTGIRNGLGVGGLQVDPGAASDPRLWVGAKPPTETTGTDGRTQVTIEQTASQAILNWQTFDVGRETDVSFAQQSSSSAVLNRISDPSANPTQILGTIKAPGTVLIMNRNGVIFGGASQVNVGNLIVAAARMTDSQFLERGIYSQLIENRYVPSFSDAYGAVTVNAGAQLTTNAPATVLAGGGYVALLGGAVANHGSITTAKGQTLLAAGDAFNLRPGYGSDANKFATTKGSEVAPMTAATSLRGTVTNAGIITSQQGDITLAGRTVVQAGVALSTTSVNQRGTIHLLNSASDALGSVTLTADSLTAVFPEVDSTETALDSRHSGLIAQSAAQDIARASASFGEFDNLSHLGDRIDQGRIEIVSGGTIRFSANSYAIANGGQIATAATRRTQVDSGAWLDVSGVRGVALDVASNAILVNVQGNELRDAPVNRDNPDKPLFNQNIWIDARDLILVPAGTGGYSADRYYTRGGLFEVSGYVANTRHQIGEWAAIGGTITLSAKEVVADRGSVFNVAGGSLTYAAGTVRNTLLQGSDGRMYTANNAPAGIKMVSAGKSFQVLHPRWGERYTETFQNPFVQTTVAVAQDGYVVGRDGGRLVLTAPTSVFNGDILADTVTGLSQTGTRPAAATDPYSLGQSTVARNGGLFIGSTLPVAPNAVIPPFLATTVSITRDGFTGTQPGLSDAIPGMQTGVTTLSSAALSGFGLGSLSSEVKGTVSVKGDLVIAPGGVINLVGGDVVLDGSITARSGSVTFSNVMLNAAPTGDITITAGSRIDVRGLWTNAVVSPELFGGKAYVDGGSVTARSIDALTIGSAAEIDASSGGNLDVSGAFTGGSGGDVTLLAGVPIPEETVGIGSGALTLGGTIRSLGVAGGGTLTLQSGNAIVITDRALSDKDRALANATNVRPALTLDPSQFTTGFSNYAIASGGNIVVSEGTTIAVTRPGYQLRSGFTAIATGADPVDVFDTVLDPLYIEDPVLGRLTQRRGASISLTAGPETISSNQTITIGTGSSISVDPGQAIRLAAPRQQTIDGTLIAPGGTVSIVSPNAPFFVRDNGRVRSIWLGQNSLIDVAGRAVSAVDKFGRRYGIAPGGGTVILGKASVVTQPENEPAGPIIDQPYVVTRPGSRILASGSATMIDLPSVNPITLAGAGGTVSIASYAGFVLDGTIDAHAGGAAAAGGTFSVTMEGLGRGLPASIVIGQSRGSPVLSPTLVPGGKDSGFTFGSGRIFADGIRNAGFGSISLLARDGLLFDGTVNLTAGQSIQLIRGTIAGLRTDANVTIAAPYVRLDGQIKVGDSTPIPLPFGRTVSRQTSTGTFSVDADHIDLAHGLFFGGGSQAIDAGGKNSRIDVAGFATVNLRSRGDIRLLDGSLFTSGDLNLAARQVYAAGFSYIAAGLRDVTDFEENPSEDSPAVSYSAALKSSGVISISRVGSDAPPTPLVTGGLMSLVAGTIDQGGILRAPLGAIYLGERYSQFPDPVFVDELYRPNITLLAGSLTSVSAAGLEIPYGGTADGIIYLDPAGKNVGVTVNGSVTTVPEPLPSQIALGGVSINIAKGAVLDLSGGGTLRGAGFISGRGGSVDVRYASLPVNPVTGVTTGGTPSIYAIVAGTQASVAPISTSAAPRLGEQISVPAGIAGLPAGVYTLLPAEYALVPGGYRVELGSVTAPSAAAQALPDGSYAVATYTSIAKTAVQSQLPLLATITPGTVVRTYSQYNEQSYADFLVKNERINNRSSNPAANPLYKIILPADAGELVLTFANAVESRLVNLGSTLFEPARGGANGAVTIGSLNGQGGNIAIYGDNRDPVFKGLHLRASDLNDLARSDLNISMNSITLLSGAVLQIPSITLDAGENGVTLKSGSRIDTTGAPTGVKQQITLNAGDDQTPGLIAINSGATVMTGGVLTFSTRGSIDVSDGAQYAATSLNLSSSYINIGDRAATGGTAPAGLNLLPGAIERLVGGGMAGGPRIANLSLTASKAINLFGPVNFDLNQAGSDVTMTLNAPAILGFGKATDAATLSAGAITWNGLGTNSRYSQSPTFVNGPGEGAGSLVLNAPVITIGGGASQAAIGFSTVRFDATSRIVLAPSILPGSGDAGSSTPNVGGSLDIFKSQAKFGAAGTGGALILNTPVLTMGSGGQFSLTAGGSLSLTGGQASAPAPSGGAGATLKLSADTVSLDSAVALPSGRLEVSAPNGVTLGANSSLLLAGMRTAIYDQTVQTPGGSLRIDTALGNIVQERGSKIDVSATGADAGSVTLIARGQNAGIITLGGSLIGAAGSLFRSGEFRIDANGFGNFSALNTLLDQGGFYERQSFTLGSGDLTINSGVRAHVIEIAADRGNLTLSSLLDASGRGAGTIRLSALNNLNINATAVLDVHGTVLQTDFYGVPIEAANRSHIELTTASGTLSFAEGATINARSADGVARGDVVFNVPRIGATANGDAAISAGGPLNLAGIASIAVNAYRNYNGIADPVGTASGHKNAPITQAYLDQIDANDSRPFITAAAANVDLQQRLAGLKALGSAFHFRPGVQIVSAEADGDLTISGDIDLSGYRYGPGVNPAIAGSGEPGALLIRAGGNLNIFGSISDGFAAPPPVSDSPFSTGWFLLPQYPLEADLYTPRTVILDAGTTIPAGAILNYALPTAGGTFVPGAVSTVALTASGEQSFETGFIATAAIRAADGKLLFQRGQTVPAGTVIPDGAVFAAGTSLPLELTVGPVVLPAGAPLPITATIDEAFTLKPGSLIPRGSSLVFAEQDGLRVLDDGTTLLETRPNGEGSLYALAPMLPQGSKSWSLRLVGGADILSADPRQASRAGNILINDPHFDYGLTSVTAPPELDPDDPENAEACEFSPELCEPSESVKPRYAPAFSVIRTGTGSLDLIAGRDIEQPTLFGVYTAGTQTAPLLDRTGKDRYQAARISLATAKLPGSIASYFPDHGGDVTLIAGRNLSGAVGVVYPPDYTYQGSFTSSASIGGWLWRQGGSGNPTAWSINFGALTPFSVEAGINELLGFQGVGTLGGGNLDVRVGGDAGNLIKNGNAEASYLSDAINLVVASTGRVRDDGMLVQTGGGTLNVSIAGTINPRADSFKYSDLAGLIAPMRGDSHVSVGRLNQIILAPGDATIDITARANLSLAGVGNPGTVKQYNAVAARAPRSDGKPTAATLISYYNLWTDRSAINLLSIGGDATPRVNLSGGTEFNDGNPDPVTRYFMPPSLRVEAPQGNIVLAPVTLELAPSPAGQLTLLAGDSIYSVAVDDLLTGIVAMSGASLDTMATPFRPATVTTVPASSDPIIQTNASPDSTSILLSFGADSQTSNIHLGDSQPNRIYAGSGDIANVQIGYIRSILPDGQIEPSQIDYVTAKSSVIYAGRDILLLGGQSTIDGSNTLTGSLLSNTVKGQVSVIKAGRDIIATTAFITGPGTLSVEAGRDLYETDQGRFESVGPLFGGNDFESTGGANIALTVGTGAAGPDYKAFAGLYLNPANQADPAFSLSASQNAGKVAKTYQAELVTWLEANYDYTGDTAQALAYFQTLSAEQQAVFYRKAFNAELVAAGREYNNSTSGRYQSYIRGRNAIAILFPTKAADGSAITYQGDITMYGGSGVKTNFGGDINVLVPGGQTLIGVNGVTPPAAAGFLTQGTGDISIYSLNSVLLGQSRVFTTFGGNIAIWSAEGDINAGRGAKTAVVDSPPKLTYDELGNVLLSPTVPTSGSGIATLNPIPDIPAGSVDLIAPLGTVDAGEAGIRVSGDVNIAALRVVNAGNIQVKGSSSGIPVVASVNTGALAAASSTASAVSSQAERMAERTRPKAVTDIPTILRVVFVGFGETPN